MLSGDISRLPSHSLDLHFNFFNWLFSRFSRPLWVQPPLTSRTPARSPPFISTLLTQLAGPNHVSATKDTFRKKTFYTTQDFLRFNDSDLLYIATESSAPTRFPLSADRNANNTRNQGWRALNSFFIRLVFRIFK